jgi:hypothetical protein
MAEIYLWKFEWDCGRNGSLEGLFVATEESVTEIIGQQVSFGEVLGKHSDIYGTIDKEDIEKVNLDTDIVEKVTTILGHTWSGYNPLFYIQHACSKCENTYSGNEWNEEKNMCDYCAEKEEENSK